ncbi:MAG: glycosyl hydrolase family 65 protein [Puniceicoccaceae bacterium]
MDSYHLDQTSFDSLLADEGLFTLGAEGLHLRGSLEEPVGDDPQNAGYMRMPGNVTAEKFPATTQKLGTYIPGVYGKHPLLNAQMINLPFAADLVLEAGDEVLDIASARIEDHHRRLDMRRAELRRELTWVTRGGVRIRLRFRRFVLSGHRRLIAQSLEITPDRDLTLRVGGGIDTDLRTSGYDHLRERRLDEADGRLHAAVRTDMGDEVEIASALRCDAALESETLREPRRIRRRLTLELTGGKTVRVERLTAYSTSRDAPKQPKAAAILEEAETEGFDRLFARHAAAWAAKWERCAIELDGPEEDRRALTASLYHLLRSNPDDARVAIEPKGYAGDAYFGRFFWDTEMYLMPFFLYTDPPAARKLLEFRLRTLDGACANARRFGYPGARFAWESDADGAENCAAWEYRDHEIHVTADIVYALAHYAANRPGDPLLEESAGLIVETARFWAARCNTRPGDDHPSLLGVMGPDEYAFLVDNNAYTNRMVKFACGLAAGELGERGGASASEREGFRELAEKLPVPRHPDHPELVLQDERFHCKVDPDFDALWPDRGKVYAAQVPQERLYRSKNLKQADVLLLQWLFAHEFTDAEREAAWDYYLPVTTHDSSLSAGIHAIVAARLGKTAEAYRFWLQASRIDLRGGAAQGIHIAGAGANWLTAVFGFAGLSTAMEDGALRLNPNLPEAWRRLRFAFRWRDIPLSFDLRHDAARITNHGAAPLPARIGARAIELQPGPNEIPLNPTQR